MTQEEVEEQFFRAEVTRDIGTQHEVFYLRVSFELLRRMDRDRFRRWTGDKLREFHEQMLAAYDEVNK